MADPTRVWLLDGYSWYIKGRLEIRTSEITNVGFQGQLSTRGPESGIERTEKTHGPITTDQHNL